MERDSNTSGGREIELSDFEPVAPWFGFSRSNAAAAPRDGTPKDRAPVTVQTVPEGRWTQDHLDRLLNTAPTEDRDTSGLVPVVSIAADQQGNQQVTSLRTDAPRFQERLDFRTPPPWNEGAGVALGASRAVEKAHSLGLRHGALQPSDVIVAGSELAVAGMGLSLSGSPEDGLPMAPEVARSGVPTVPGDVYSLGLLLKAGTAGDPNTPQEISQLITDATAEDVADRVPSALAFSERLSAAGGDVMRAYTPMDFATSPLVGIPSASAAVAAPIATTAAATSAAAASGATAATTVGATGSTGKILPWIVGAGLAGVVGFGLWAAATGGGTESGSTTTLAPTTVTTELPTTTVPTTTSTNATSATTQPNTTTTTAADTTTTTAPPRPPEVEATPIEDAGLELLHGLEDPPVDAYLNGELLVAGFEPGEIAGPLALDAGNYDLQLFAATDDPAASAIDRDDNPIVTESVALSGSPETLVVGSDGADGVALSAFADDLSAVGAGQGRISLRNPTDSTIIVSVDPNPFMEGQALERQAIAPGAVFARDLPAGDYRLFVSEEDGTSLLATVVSNTEGEVTAGTFLNDDNTRMIFQRVGGVGTPPGGIPTGTSGLLPGSNDPVQGLLIAAAGSLGLFALIGRERFRRSGDR